MDSKDLLLTNNSSADRMAPLSPSERLPTELKHMILCFVPDVFSLCSVVSSCSSFRRTFENDERKITTKVLANHIHPSVLPDAVARYMSSIVDSDDCEAIQRFIAMYYQNSESVGKELWSLRSALGIARFHILVESFREALVSDTDAFFPEQDLSASQPATPITPSETFRFQRALYRYEVYCNLFKGHTWQQWIDISRDNYREMAVQGEFISCFSPWENEQLICVYDFLWRKTFPIFKVVAEHDIEWASHGIKWNGYMGARYVQAFLSTGLQRIDQLFRARTFEQRQRIMSRGLTYRRYFLPNAFTGIDDEPSGRADLSVSDLSRSSPHADPTLCEFTEDEERAYVNPSFYRDPDPGPAESWRWAHQLSIPNQLAGGERQEHVRKWCFVMWDVARIKALRVFHEPFMPHYQRPESADERLRQFREMKRSIAARKTLFDKGGRGWWSRDDESQVVWTKPTTFEMVSGGLYDLIGQ